MTELFDREDIRCRIAQHYGLDVDPFTTAMIATEMEDVLTKPCMGCGGPAERTILWTLPGAIFRGRIPIPSGKSPALIVPVCARCGDRTRIDGTFAARILKAGIENVIENASEMEPTP
jgi:hypothetical protein